MPKIEKSKITLIFFELILVFLLSTISFADNKNQNDKSNMQNVNLLIRRALLFDHFLDVNDWAAYGELLKDRQTQKEDSINLIIYASYMPPPHPNLSKRKTVNYKEIIPYNFVFGNQIYDVNDENDNDQDLVSDDEDIMIGYLLRPMIMMAFRNEGKHEIACYIEYASAYNTEILFDKNTRPQLFQHRYYNYRNGHFDYENTTEINWDENGKITSIEKLDRMPKLPHWVSDLSKKTEKPRQLPTINLNTIKDQKILQVLQRAEKICLAKNFKELLECPKELPLFDKKNDHPAISVRLVNNKLQHIFIVRDSLDNEKLSYYGYFLSFKNDNLNIYAEGDIPLKITNYYDATIKDNTKLDNLSIDGKGIEIKFHPNGFPASYKSIVQNRLYGRQIEWDDKGEIVSDVDLDIPKKWKDAPKENKSQPK